MLGGRLAGWGDRGPALLGRGLAGTGGWRATLLGRRLAGGSRRTPLQRWRLALGCWRTPRRSGRGALRGGRATLLGWGMALGEWGVALACKAKWDGEHRKYPPVSSAARQISLITHVHPRWMRECGCGEPRQEGCSWGGMLPGMDAPRDGYSPGRMLPGTDAPWDGYSPGWMPSRMDDPRDGHMQELSTSRRMRAASVVSPFFASQPHPAMGFSPGPPRLPPLRLFSCSRARRIWLCRELRFLRRHSSSVSSV